MAFEARESNVLQAANYTEVSKPLSVTFIFPLGVWNPATVQFLPPNLGAPFLLLPFVTLLNFWLPLTSLGTKGRLLVGKVWALLTCV